MSSSPRSLITLPEDILIEVLSRLLVDTPRSIHKVGILRTCSVLHALGLPLLYRVVDLRGYRSAFDALRLWTSLLGPGGLLATDGRLPELGSSVVELRLGLPGVRRRRDRLRVAQQDFVFGPVHLPRCTTLVYSDAHLVHFHSSSPFVSVLANLPVTHLIMHKQPALRNSPEAQTLLAPVPSFLLDHTPRLWPDLDTVHTIDTLRYDLDQTGSWFTARLGFAYWPVRTLVVDLPRREQAKSRLWVASIRGPDLFLDWNASDQDTADAEDSTGGGEERWTGLKRVELRVSREIEAKLRRKVDLSKKEGRLERYQRRILPLIVFVDEDGAERRLIEDEETF